MLATDVLVVLQKDPLYVGPDHRQNRADVHWAVDWGVYPAGAEWASTVGADMSAQVNRATMTGLAARRGIFTTVHVPRRAFCHLG